MFSKTLQNREFVTVPFGRGDRMEKLCVVLKRNDDGSVKIISWKPVAKEWSDPYTIEGEKIIRQIDHHEAMKFNPGVIKYINIKMVVPRRRISEDEQIKLIDFITEFRKVMDAEMFKLSINGILIAWSRGEALSDTLARFRK